MTNRDLLKEAIADAKAVKETALTNAKLALEEAFTPFLRDKLSAKLAEMEEADDKEEVSEVTTSEEKVDEEISLEELLAELNEEDSTISETEVKDDTKVDEAKKKEEEDDLAIEDMSEDDLKSFIEDVIKDMVAAGELEAGEETEEEGEGPLGSEKEEEEEVVAEEEMDEEVNLEELLAELEADKVEEVVKPIAEKTKDSEVSKTEGELKEAYETIKTLKNDLNEINLLNAKLLYTNKIFRNKSLNESQKIKVLSAFDKATTKKEVELVYETLKEGLKQPITKSPIKESLSSASKPLGSASKPIIENEAFARMCNLAGIKKK